LFHFSSNVLAFIPPIYQSLKKAFPHEVDMPTCTFYDEEPLSSGQVSDMAQERYEVIIDVLATFGPYPREYIKRFGEYTIDLETIPPLLEPDKPFLSLEETALKETAVI
jgi:hypothetical protein